MHQPAAEERQPGNGCGWQGRERAGAQVARGTRPPSHPSHSRRRLAGCSSPGRVPREPEPDVERWGWAQELFFLLTRWQWLLPFLINQVALHLEGFGVGG